MGIEPYKIHSRTSSLKIIGDVNKVLTGTVSESNLIGGALESLGFGLGASTFGSCDCLGESLILNQVGYVSFVNQQKKLETHIKSTGLYTPFLMGLQPGSQPSQVLSLNYPEGFSLYSLFEKISYTFQAFAFVGRISFKTLACTYLKKPPIFNETVVGENTEKYWAKTEELPNCYAYVFGVVITEEGKNNFPKEKLAKAFYANPQEKNQGNLLSHTHAALIKENVGGLVMNRDEAFYTTIDPSHVEGIRHIFTQSVVKDGLLAVFEIKDIVETDPRTHK
jgi:hypothetical protein